MDPSNFSFLFYNNPIGACTDEDGTRPSANSGHNAHNFCNFGVATLVQVTKWTE